MNRKRPELPEVFTGLDAVSAGALTARELRGPRVKRIIGGVYCPAEVRVTVERRCQAVALVAPNAAVISGPSALTLYGAPASRTEEPIHVVIPPHQRFARGPDVLVRRRLVLPHEATQWGDRRLGYPGAGHPRLLLGRPVLDSVPLLDPTLRTGLVKVDELLTMLTGRSDRGIVLARQALALADQRAESRPESWTRVVLVLAGLNPTPQVEIFDERGFVARVDLAFERERVAVEYEGAHYGDPSMLRPDRERLDRLRQAGRQVVFVTASDRYRPQTELVGRVRGALLTRL